jgi:riboflavin synthase
MFTGIVEEAGQVVSFRPEAEAWELVIAAEAVRQDAALGDSIAVNGCCLTIARMSGAQLHFDVLEETRRLTNFNAFKSGSLANLERSLRFGGKVGGHFVTGHIDTTGEILVLEPRGKDHYLRIRVPETLSRYIVHKGSIAIDGISLTIAEVSDDEFAVWLIPHTMLATNLHSRRAGDAVNLEFDLLGKHIEKLMSYRTT